MLTLLRKHFFAYLKEVCLRVLFLESFDMSPQGIDRLVIALYQRFVDPEVIDQWMDEAVAIFSQSVKALLSDLYDDVTALAIMRGHAIITEPDRSSFPVRPEGYRGCVSMDGEVIPVPPDPPSEEEEI